MRETLTVYKVEENDEGHLILTETGLICNGVSGLEHYQERTVDVLPGLSHIEWNLIEDPGWNGHPADGHIGQAISAGDFYVGADKLFDHTPKYVASRFDDLADYEI